MLEISEHKEHFTVIDSKTGHSKYINKDTFFALVEHLKLKPTEANTSVMKRGRTEVETLRLNGWVVGDILMGDEGRGPDLIVITAIGDERFLCKWDYGCKGTYAEESGSTTLTCREWKKVGESRC